MQMAELNADAELGDTGKLTAQAKACSLISSILQIERKHLQRTYLHWPPQEIILMSNL